MMLDNFGILLSSSFLEQPSVSEAEQVGLKNNKLKDGYTWRCRPCESTITIVKDFSFASGYLSFKQILILMYEWIREGSQKDSYGGKIKAISHYS